MRKWMTVASIAAVLTAAFALGFTSAASAQTSDGQGIGADTAVDHAGGPGRGGRGPGGPGGPREPRGTPGTPREPGNPPAAPSEECLALMHAVRTACPCQGPDGNGWGSHDDYVQCVTTALGGATDECATKILERATKSKVGEPGFECKRPHRRGPGHPKPTATPEGL